MARGKGNKADRRKKLSYVVVQPKSDQGQAMYAMLKELIQEHHDDELRDARIALAWATSWKADIDGRVQLGKCKKIGDPERELMKQDFVIILRKEFWENPSVKDEQRRALLDHELSHAALKFDEDGEPVEDEKGRKVYRIRKHDIEEFTAIVDRYGCYKRDLEQFASALKRGKQRHLFDHDAADRSQSDQANGGVAGHQPVA